jgi:uncharacterized low-complexity protein
MKTRKNVICLAFGASALVGTLAATPIVSADSNPFSFNDLGNGYMVADAGDKAKKDGSCGESKCGDKKANEEKAKEATKKSKDDSCGESKCSDKKA